MRQLRQSVGMPIGLPISAWAVRLAAPILFRTDPELALYGRYVIPKRLQDESFQFQFPQLGQALAELMAS
jgi:NAD dependent epimerase/dehydratase family enzyme